jgi:hypothetical protein
MKDIVTVAFDRDFYILLLQAQSINKFVTDCTHWIFIQSTTKSFEEWEDALSPYYINNRLNLINSSYMSTFSSTVHYSGWCEQQVLKLTASNKIKEESYLILDSKNIFIRHTDLSDWPFEEGNGLYMKNPKLDPTLDRNSSDNSVQKDFANFFDFLQEKFNKYDYVNYWTPHTPFRLKTAIVKKLIEEIDNNWESVFNPSISGVKSPSEFILYRYYTSLPLDQIQYEPQYYQIPFYNTNRNYQNFWGACENEIVFKDCISNPQIKMLGFHRHFLRKLPETYSSKIISVFIQLGFDEKLLVLIFNSNNWQTEY